MTFLNVTFKISEICQNLTCWNTFTDKWSEDIIQEKFLGALIDKLTSPSVIHSAIAELISVIGNDKCEFQNSNIAALSSLALF